MTRVKNKKCQGCYYLTWDITHGCLSCTFLPHYDMEIHYRPIIQLINSQRIPREKGDDNSKTPLAGKVEGKTK